MRKCCPQRPPQERFVEVLVPSPKGTQPTLHARTQLQTFNRHPRQKPPVEPLTGGVLLRDQGQPAAETVRPDQLLLKGLGSVMMLGNRLVENNFPGPLALEVMVKSTLGNTHGAEDVVQGRPPEAVAAEQVSCRLYDSIACVRRMAYHNKTLSGVDCPIIVASIVPQGPAVVQSLFVGIFSCFPNRPVVQYRPFACRGLDCCTQIGGQGRPAAYASVAQLDRASVFGTEGWGFESLRTRFFFCAFLC